METTGRRLSATLLATIFVATTATACVIMPPSDMPAPSTPGTTQPGNSSAPTETTAPENTTQTGIAPSEEACTEALFTVVGEALAEGSNPRPGEFDVPGLQDVVILDCQHSFDINQDTAAGSLDWDSASIGVLHQPAPGDQETIQEWFESDGWETSSQQISGVSYVKEDPTVTEPGQNPDFKYGEAVEIYQLTDLAQPEQIEAYEETTGATLADDALAVIYAKGYVVTEQ